MNALKERGISRNFVNSLMPAHWETSFYKERSGYLRACTLISRALNLELRPLLAEQPQVTPRDSHLELRYKKSANKNEYDVEMAGRTGCTAARLALDCFEHVPYSVLPPDPFELRKAVLASGRPWVALVDLLDYCWESGIAILHLPLLPGKKMDGMAVSIEGRPVILISKGDKFRSRVAFTLAHEMGHIARGHLQANSLLVDDEIRRDSPEEEEIEANRYALALLLDHEDRAYNSDQTMYPDRLAQAALLESKRVPVDPAAIVNNWTYHECKRRRDAGLPKEECNLPYGTGTRALGFLKEPTDGLALIQDYCRRNLDEDSMSRDALGLFRRLTGADG